MIPDKDVKVVGPPIDGIEEYDNPLPRWWLMMFYGSIVFAVIYQVLYPSWFGPGLLKWSAYNQYNEEMKQAAVLYPKKEINIVDFLGKPDQIEKGRQIFQQNCTACHGPEAKGLIGPNLTDNVWIHGGKSHQIVKTITNGVQEKGMPSWGKPLGAEKVAQVASFVYSLSPEEFKTDPAPVQVATKTEETTEVANEETKAEETKNEIQADEKAVKKASVNIAELVKDSKRIKKGKTVFQQKCVACHGPEAKGLVGPNLTDSEWIHGGEPENIYNTISKGVPAKGMPSWGTMMSDEEVQDATAFVYSLSNK